MIIREADYGDLPELTDMGKDFYLEGSFVEKGLAFSKRDMIDFFIFLIDSEAGLLLVAEDGEIIGSIGGLSAPWMLNYGQRTITETWWYVDPLRRGGSTGIKLLKEFERKAKQMGCTHCIMATQNNNEEKLGKVYQRLNYRPLEYQYIKEL